MLNKSLVIASLFASSFANAAAWSDPVTVKSVWTEGVSDLIGIELLEGAPVAQGCSPNWLLFKADNEQRRGRAFSSLNAAVLSGAKVQLWINDTCTSWNYSEATAVRLLKR